MIQDKAETRLFPLSLIWTVTVQHQWPSFITSSSHRTRLTVGEGANGSRWDPSVDPPEAPCFVEALLALQSCLNGVQREEGQIHTHPCTSPSLQTQTPSPSRPRKRQLTWPLWTKCNALTLIICLRYLTKKHDNYCTNENKHFGTLSCHKISQLKCIDFVQDKK